MCLSGLYHLLQKKVITNFSSQKGFLRYCISKATEMLVAILNTCTQDDDDEDEKINPEVSGKEDTTTDSTIDPSIDPTEQEAIDEESKKRREVIRNKIRAVGKVSCYHILL